MRGTGGQESKWNIGLRYIPDIPVDRAEFRMTVTYAILPGAFLGVEYNPLDDDVGLLANWRIVDETKSTPMLMVGTSSDRIGTPNGRAYYTTLAKSFRTGTSISLAPYVGLSYGEFDDEWIGIGGMGVRWMKDLASTSSYDGHNLHHMLDYTLTPNHRIGFVLAEQGSKHYGGVSLGWTF